MALIVAPGASPGEKADPTFQSPLGRLKDSIVPGGTPLQGAAFAPALACGATIKKTNTLNLFSNTSVATHKSYA